MKRLEEMPDLEHAAVIIPQPLENLKLPNPDLLVYYQNLEDRIIWIDYAVDDTIFDVSKAILRFNREDEGLPVEKRKPIKLLVYSYGGDGSACFSLVDTIALSKTPVYTYNMGVSMSAGLLILLAGHKRYCLPHSTALIHSGSGGTSGTFESTEAQMQDYKHFVKEMREYILSRTSIDTKLMNKKKSQEWYIYADEQKELGIVNGIISSLDEIVNN